MSNGEVDNGPQLQAKYRRASFGCLQNMPTLKRDEPGAAPARSLYSTPVLFFLSSAREMAAAARSSSAPRVQPSFGREPYPSLVQVRHSGQRKRAGTIHPL